MTQTKTKKALLMSVLSMVLCVAMLVGMTFAWFTDTASTAVNTIQSGTLKVDIVDESGDSIKGKSISFVNKNDSTDILWEPGVTFRTKGFKIKNIGKLALKYKIVLNGITGDADLLKVIDFSVVKADGTKVNLDNFTGELKTENEMSEVLYIQGHMDEAAGNEYQDKTLESVAIKVYATQLNHEFDSIGQDYDKDAPFSIEPVSTADEMKAAIEAGKDVSLTKDITLTEQFEITKDVTIQGNGNTLTAPNGDNARVLNLEKTSEDVTITLKDVNLEGPTSGAYTRGIAFFQNTGKVRVVMDNCTASANYYAINVAGGNSDIELTIKNSKITGWCAAQTWSANSKLTFENCTLIGNNVYDGEGNGFATLVVNTDATGSVLELKNCRIDANTLGTSDQCFFSLRTSATISCEKCSFYKNGTKVATKDVMKNVELWGDATSNDITIK